MSFDKRWGNEGPDRAPRGREAGLTAISIFAALAFFAPTMEASGETTLERGAYLFAAAGCKGCHTDSKKKGPLLGGGRGLKTPFGTFFGSNITPHPEQGIGKWSDADFIRALREGVAPDGSNYFPVFPYPSFTGMTDKDLMAIKAYIFTLAASDQPNRPHENHFPFNLRFLQTAWKSLNFTPGPFEPDPKRPAAWNRGAYLVRAVVHCGECHTPRNEMGGLDRALAMAGTDQGPEGESVPNITPDEETGIGRWSEDDITTYLESGIHPEGDLAGSLMAEIVDDSTGKLSQADRTAIAVYLKSLKPIRNRLGKAAGSGG